MIGQQGSHYRLEVLLGEGTHGAVHRGVHVADGALVAAVKVVHRSLATDAEFVSALRAECRLLARRRACPDGPFGTKVGWHIGVGVPDVRAVRSDIEPLGMAA